LPLLAGVSLGDIEQRLGVIGEGFLVADFHPAIPAAPHQLLGRGARDGIAREALVRPFLEALAEEGTADATVAVEAAREHKALLAAARIPARRRLIA
jgi:hypothetical protein